MYREKTLHCRNDGKNIVAVRHKKLCERPADLPEEDENNLVNYFLHWHTPFSVE
jgi:hypothetical protein